MRTYINYWNIFLHLQHLRENYVKKQKLLNKCNKLLIMKYFWSMRSTNLCTPILINDSTCKIVATAYVTAHMSKSISSIPALLN